MSHGVRYFLGSLIAPQMPNFKVYFTNGTVDYVGSEDDIEKRLNKPGELSDDDSGFREL